jgi:short-subunit dehydrogenase
MIINNAGILDFTLFEEQPIDRIEQMIKINTLAPIQLVRLLMPYFLKQDGGHIVNIGSIFGSLAFPHYVVYSASKYAMRGFSQALARELADTGIKVTYVGPRAVQTPLNDATSLQMMTAGKMRLDTPTYVAGRIVSAIEQDKREVYIGFPEKLFAWLNGFIPQLISCGIKEQTRQARIFASRHD